MNTPQKSMNQSSGYITHWLFWNSGSFLSSRLSLVCSSCTRYFQLCDAVDWLEGVTGATSLVYLFITMSEIAPSCFSCASKAEHVLVQGDRMHAYCGSHLLHHLHTSTVHTVFPISAWRFASTLPEFDSTLINDFLTLESLIRRIKNVQEEEWSRRQFRTEGTSTPSTSEIRREKEALDYVTAALNSVLLRVNAEPRELRSPDCMLRYKALYMNYLPVLLSTQKEDYRKYLEFCEEKCSKVGLLIGILGTLKELMEGEVEYFQHRSMLHMCELIESLSLLLSRSHMEFLKSNTHIKVSLQDIVTFEITSVCSNLRMKAPISSPRNTVFLTKIIPLWEQLADMSLTIDNSEAASWAFIRKGEAYQALKEYTEAEGCYTFPSDIAGGDSTNKGFNAVAEVRKGLLYVEKKEFQRAAQCFQTNMQRVESMFQGGELFEVYVGCIKTTTALNQIQETLSLITKLNALFTNFDGNYPLIYSAEYFKAIGDYYGITSQPAAAIDYLRKAIDCYGKSGDVESEKVACLSLAVKLEQLGRWQEALCCYHTAVENMSTSSQDFARIRDRMAACQQKCC